MKPAILNRGKAKAITGKESRWHAWLDHDVWTILHGVEEGRPWTMLITEETGRFSLVVNEDDAAFNVFGACTSP